MYIDKLDDIAHIYYNAYLRTTKLKPVDVKSNTYDKDSKFKIADIVRISKYKKKFDNGYVPDWSEEASVIKVFKIPVAYAVSDLSREEIVRAFCEKELQKAIQRV